MNWYALMYDDEVVAVRRFRRYPARMDFGVPLTGLSQCYSVVEVEIRSLDGARLA